MEIVTSYQKDIHRLEQFFASAKLPDTLQLGKHQTITNVPQFIESHLAFLKSNDGKERFGVYLDRLVQVEEILKNK